MTLDHGDGILTRYAHTAANLVNAGADVAAGQEIALVGTTGRSTAPHLHFEMHRNGQPIDPMQVVGFQQVSSGARKGCFFVKETGAAADGKVVSPRKHRRTCANEKNREKKA